MSMSLVQGKGFRPAIEIVHGDGTVTDTWRRGDQTVTVTGRPGVAVAIVEKEVGVGETAKKTLAVNATTPAIDKSDSRAVAKQLAWYAASGRSVVKSAIRSGMDPAAAHARFGDMQNVPAAPAVPVPIVPPSPNIPSGVPKYGTRANGHPKTAVHVPSTALSGGTRNSSTMFNSNLLLIESGSDSGNGRYYDDICTSIKAGDGGDLEAYGCEVQYLDYRNGSDWWIGDEFRASGVSTDTCTNCWSPARLTQIWVDIAYGSGNRIVKWNPTSTTHPPSSCHSVTFGVSSPKTGLGYSETMNVCSESVGPHVLSTNEQGTRFGTVWNGKEPSANWWEATHGADVNHSPPQASASVCIGLGIAWRPA
jgi:hypothetical protein